MSTPTFPPRPPPRRPADSQYTEDSFDIPPEVTGQRPVNRFEKRQSHTHSVSDVSSLSSAVTLPYEEEDTPAMPAPDPNAHLGPLPEGWELRLAATGQVYFADFHTQTTTWEDPRNPVESTVLDPKKEPSGSNALKEEPAAIEQKVVESEVVLETKYVLWFSQYVGLLATPADRTLTLVSEPHNKG